MVNLRYHIVSLVAVFLALGVGILMGATVVDRGIVRLQDRNLHTLESRLADRRRATDALSRQLNRWNAFADQSKGQLLIGRLRGVPILVVGVEGVDRKPVDDFRRQLVGAGAVDEGVAWLTPRLNLTDGRDASALGSAVGSPATTPDTLRRDAMTALAAFLTGKVGQGGPGSSPTPLLVALRDAGFVDYEDPTTQPPGLDHVPLPGTRLVLVSGAGAKVVDSALAVPLARDLASTGIASVVAVESGSDAAGRRAVFVGPLRRDGATAGVISTVDDLETYYGQLAALLAVEDLASNTVGNFGVGPGADRLLPAPNS
ncbi:MAG: copper transporter [Actinobacteria bacterium]|nr:MAG: copper transporter [Actinomycetota bacterium]